MAAVFLPNQNVNTLIAAEAPGHVFDAGTEPWLDQYGALGCLRFCSLSPFQSNRCIIGQGSYNIISFIDIRLEKVEGIGKITMVAKTASLRINQPYRIL